jgi:hypothetical protein
VKRNPLRQALIATVLFRVLCSVFAFRFAQQVPRNDYLAAKNQFSAHLMGPADGWRYLLIGIWERFDTLWYLHIASHGYDLPAATVFYPLYPFLIRCLSWATRSPTLAALLISTVACFFLFWGVQKLASLDWPGTEAWALILTAAWPAAFVFFAGYPESLLIALVVWSIYLARTDRWWLAGVLAFAAGLTKAAGVLACVPLGVLLLYERRWRAIPAVILAPLGFLSFTIWLRMSGFPSAATIYAKYWNTQVSMPWTTLFAAFPPVFRDGDWLVGLNLIALLFCVAILFNARTLRLDYLLFSAACLTMFLSKRSEPLLQSTPRYVLLMFPVFLCWARRIKRPAAGILVVLLLMPFYFAMLRTFLWWGLIV